jgi:hypothetical protein
LVAGKDDLGVIHPLEAEKASSKPVLLGLDLVEFVKRDKLKGADPNTLGDSEVREDEDAVWCWSGQFARFGLWGRVTLLVTPAR